MGKLREQFKRAFENECLRESQESDSRKENWVLYGMEIGSIKFIGVLYDLSLEEMKRKVETFGQIFPSVELIDTFSFDQLTHLPRIKKMIRELGGDPDSDMLLYYDHNYQVKALTLI